MLFFSNNSLSLIFLSVIVGRFEVAINKIILRFIFDARGQGLEPRLAASKAGVLPLDDPRNKFSSHAPPRRGALPLACLPVGRATPHPPPRRISQEGLF